MTVALALALTVSGCLCLYLASPNQRWLGRALPIRLAVLGGCLLLATGLAAWAAMLHPVAAFFVALHVAMACLFAFPYLAALRSLGRSRPDGG